MKVRIDRFNYVYDGRSTIGSVWCAVVVDASGKEVARTRNFFEPEEAMREGAELLRKLNKGVEA